MLPAEIRCSCKPECYSHANWLASALTPTSILSPIEALILSDVGGTNASASKCLPSNSVCTDPRRGNPQTTNKSCIFIPLQNFGTSSILKISARYISGWRHSLRHIITKLTWHAPCTKVFFWTNSTRVHYRQPLVNYKQIKHKYMGTEWELN